MTHPLSQRAGLSATALKLIAVAAMTGDHLGWAFLPNASAAGVLVHLLGRITMPLMCFFIAEGYRCTRSVPRYALRLFFCALASAIPYSYYQTGELFSNPFSVLYTLLLGLLAIWACDRIPQPFLRAAVLLGLFLLSVPGDWGAYAVGWCLIFFLLRDRPGPCAACFCALCLLHVLEAFSAGVSCGWGAAELFCATFVQSGCLLALPLLSFYDGRRGGERVHTPTRESRGDCLTVAPPTAAGASPDSRRRRGGSLFFYLYYPLHLTAIDLLRRRLYG